MKKLVSVISTVLVLLLVINISMYQYSRIKNDPKNLAYVTMKERMRQLDCLADNIYYEAAGENFESKAAVAIVTINRTNESGFPDDICKVVYQKSQFSWTIEKPKALVKLNKNAYNESMDVAKAVLLEGFRLNSVKDAVFYHTTSVSPHWKNSFVKVAIIGNHIFYKKS